MSGTKLLRSPTPPSPSHPPALDQERQAKDRESQEKEKDDADLLEILALLWLDVTVKSVEEVASPADRDPPPAGAKWLKLFKKKGTTARSSRLSRRTPET